MDRIVAKRTARKQGPNHLSGLVYIYAFLSNLDAIVTELDLKVLVLSGKPAPGGNGDCQRGGDCENF